MPAHEGGHQHPGDERIELFEIEPPLLGTPVREHRSQENARRYEEAKGMKREPRDVKRMEIRNSDVGDHADGDGLKRPFFHRVSSSSASGGRGKSRLDL